jgi:Anion-transporting ATPase
MALPEIVFVLGKGGVGRSTVSAALGLSLAERGERVLIMEWAVSEAIAPWFGSAPAEPERGGDWRWIPAPREVAPGLSVFNYRLREALRGYFADHLRLPLFYRKVIDGPHVRKLVEAAPGLAELLFIGQLWWMTSLAESEAGLHFDRIVVDAPATGHGATLLDLPKTLSGIGASGLLATEAKRVLKMVADPKRTGALVVSLPEELAVQETRALVPRTARDLGRPPLALLVNRSVAGWVSNGVNADFARGWPISEATHNGLDVVTEELRSRVRYESELRSELADATELGAVSLAEQLVATGDGSPPAVVRALSRTLGDSLRGAA